MKQKIKEIKISEVSICPMYDNNLGWIDYVYGLVGTNIAIKAFKEPNRVEESNNALDELYKLKFKEKK